LPATLFSKISVIKMGTVLEDLKGDKIHVLVLFFLYVLQGIPVGLYKSIPLILTNLNVPYKIQAIFSIAYYPYSMKLLWAPLVDSLYLPRFGRRKTWLIPTQCLIGVTMLVGSQFISGILGESEDPDESSDPDITSLTIMFFILTFLTATQDVATDGWALTMLKPSNVGYASTCQSVGLTAGFCLGYILFTVLESNGIITISQFLAFWGVVVLVSTTAIALFKKEEDTNSDPDEVELGLVGTYKALWKMICNPMLLRMIFFLATYGFGVSVAESMTNLKLIEKGVPKETIALLEIPMIPVKIVVTLFVTRFTVGSRPMNVWIISFPLRLFFCLAMTLLVFVAPLVMQDDGKFPTAYFASIIGVFALDRAMSLAMWVAIIAFFARISDPKIGGTCMSFFTTINNLGTRWPISFNLWLVDLITYKNCVIETEDMNSSLPESMNVTSASNLNQHSCYEKTGVDGCTSGGGTCVTTLDGFYILSIVCVVIGYLWFIWAAKAMTKWQELEVTTWRVCKEKRIEENEDEMQSLKSCLKDT